MYGFCDGKVIHAIAEYHRSFLNRIIPNQRIFTRFYQISRDTSTLTDDRITAGREFNEEVSGKQNVVLFRE